MKKYLERDLLPATLFVLSRMQTLLPFQKHIFLTNYESEPYNKFALFRFIRRII
jgi:hypothetical protein